MQRSVRGIEGNVSEEGFVFLGALGDELVGLVEKDIGAEAFGGNDFSVVEVVSIKVRVIPEIGSLPHAATAVAVDFGEAAVFGAVGIVVAEVPLAEHAGGVVGGKMLADGDFVFADHRATLNGVPDAGAVGPVTGKQRGAGGRASRRDVVVGEDSGLVVEFIEMGRFDDRIAVAGEVAVALVVGDDKNDVGLLAKAESRGGSEEESREAHGNVVIEM